MTHGTQPLAGYDIAIAGPQDAPELLVLQRCCWVEEAILNETLAIPALHEDVDEVVRWIRDWRVWVLRRGHRMVGAVRARPVAPGVRRESRARRRQAGRPVHRLSQRAERPDL